MLKKFGLVAMGLTAGLVAFAPLASAQDHGQSDCASQADDQGNTGQLDQCNITGNDVGQNNGQGNVLVIAGVPVPIP